MSIEGFTPVYINDEKVVDFITDLVNRTNNPQEFVAYLASAFIFAHTNAALPGVSLEQALDSFRITVLILHANMQQRQ